MTDETVKSIGQAIDDLNEALLKKPLIQETVTNEVTNEKRAQWLEPYHFKPGNSGRPRGSRNRLSDRFIAALEDDFKAHGETAICRVREERPQDYIKVIAMLLPKDVNINVSEYEQLSDEQLTERIARLHEYLGPLISQARDGGTVIDRRETPENALVVQDIPGSGSAQT